MKTTSLSQKVAIIGYGVEGQAAARYWARQGASVTICDRNPELKLPKAYQAQLGLDEAAGINYLAGLGIMDLIVRSPGIRPADILAANPLFPGLARRITSSIREFMRVCPAPVIGVTGTKGKGTTSTLIARILEAAGQTVWLGGNIGQSPLEFLPNVAEDHVVVLELSSFQLIDLDTSPEIAVCLMMAPDHQDWHPDMAEYLTAKSQLFAHQRTIDLAIYKADDPQSRQVASASAGRQLPYGAEPGARVVGDTIMIDDTVLCQTSEVGLPGAHNLENICAAVTAVWELVGRRAQPIRTAVKAFTGLEHRLELAGTAAGVRYYDDSFSTHPSTAIAAIKAFAEPKVIILGGSDKGAVYAELAQAVEHGGVIHALLIGDTAPAIEKALRLVGFTHVTTGITTMQQLVDTCYHITEPGDVVLLSPACASFGLFKNYKERGDQFKAAVHDLATRLAQAA